MKRKDEDVSYIYTVTLVSGGIICLVFLSVKYNVRMRLCFIYTVTLISWSVTASELRYVHGSP